MRGYASEITVCDLGSNAVLALNSSAVLEEKVDA